MSIKDYRAPANEFDNKSRKMGSDFKDHLTELFLQLTQEKQDP